MAEWRHCAVRFGAKSGSAKGALLEAVRELWGDGEAWASPQGCSGRWVVNIETDDPEHDPPEGDDELDALSSALEFAP